MRSCYRNPAIDVILLSLGGLSLFGCRNAETISPDEFVKRYDEVRYRKAYNDYAGIRGRYHFLDQYGLGHQSVVKRRSSVRCAVADLPTDFPTQPQREFEPDRCIGNIPQDAGPCPFAYSVTAIKHPVMLDYVAANLARDFALGSGKAIDQYAVVGGRPLGESWWIRFERVPLSLEGNVPKQVDFFVQPNGRVVASGLDQLPRI